MTLRFISYLKNYPHTIEFLTPLKRS